MTRLHVWRGDGFRVVPLAVSTALDASQASRAVRGSFVEYRSGSDRRFYVNGRRVTV